MFFFQIFFFESWERILESRCFCKCMETLFFWPLAAIYGNLSICDTFRFWYFLWFVFVVKNTYKSTNCCYVQCIFFSVKYETAGLWISREPWSNVNHFHDQRCCAKYNCMSLRFVFMHGLKLNTIKGMLWQICMWHYMIVLLLNM